jgi:hypothetical protein
VLVDMALRTQVIGRIEVTRYLERVLDRAPYGHASTLRHIVGGRDGGGFEWTASPDAGRLGGITALELDTHGLITAITSVYDSRQIDPASNAPSSMRRPGSANGAPAPGLLTEQGGPHVPRAAVKASAADCWFG